MRPGDNVGERYQIVKKLGSGGMGTLWRARHLELEIDVALKVVSPAEEDANSLARFEREAKAVARLKSPHIVSVMDYGVFGGRPVLVMELLQGEDLASLIAREGHVELERCRHIVDQVCKGVQVAHDAGIIHRDLKPANVFLERVGDDEVVKVLDFGVAKDLEREERGHKTSTGALVGSPAYMSPEQVWNQKVGYPSDVWALGVVTLEMLTGTQPFEDDSMAKIFEHIVRDPLPKPSSLNGLLPVAMDELFERVFERDPAKRVQSAREFRALFDEALGIERTSLSPSERTRTSSQSVDTPLSLAPPATLLMDRAATQHKIGARAWAVGLALGTIAVGLAVLVTRPKHEGDKAADRPSLAAEHARTERDDPPRTRPPAASHDDDARATAAPQPRPPEPSAAAKILSGRSTLPGRSEAPPRHTVPVLQKSIPAATASAKPATTLDPRFGVPVTE
jgi:serine/threonine protein kinase